MYEIQYVVILRSIFFPKVGNNCELLVTLWRLVELIRCTKLYNKPPGGQKRSLHTNWFVCHIVNTNGERGHASLKSILSH